MSDTFYAPFEVKFAGDAGEGSFAGYGAVFANTDRHGDMIQKGAFKESIRAAKKTGIWPALLLEHGFASPLPIGVLTAMEEDEKGLYVEGQIATATPRGAEVYALLKMAPRPALQGMSIGYIARDYKLNDKPGEPYRTLKAIELVEISFVATPANMLAAVDRVKRLGAPPALESFAKRLRDGEPPAIKEFEDILREAGVPKAMAAQIASVGYAKAIRSESGGKATTVTADDARALREALAALK